MTGKKHKNSKGFLMVEIIVAISIIAVSVLAAMAVSQKSVQASRQAFHSAQAAFLAEEGAEAVRIARDNGWANISGLSEGTAYYALFSGGTWTLTQAQSSIGIFTRTITVESVGRDSSSGDIDAGGADDPGTKLVTVSVSWTEGGTAKTKSLQFYIFDIFS